MCLNTFSHTILCTAYCIVASQHRYMVSLGRQQSELNPGHLASCWPLSFPLFHLITSKSPYFQHQLDDLGTNGKTLMVVRSAHREGLQYVNLCILPLNCLIYQLQLSAIVLQWTLAYPATMGLDNTLISEIVQYVNHHANSVYMYNVRIIISIAVSFLIHR